MMGNYFLELSPLAEAIHNILVSQHPLGLYKVRANGEEVVYFCPFHEDRRHPNLHVNYRMKVFHCFACHASGTLDYLYKYLTGVDVGEMKGSSELLEFWDVETEMAGKSDIEDIARDRKLKSETLEACDIRKVKRTSKHPFASEAEGRLLFPVYDFARKYIYNIVGYANKEVIPKYKYFSGAKVAPFGYHLISELPRERIFIVEGIFDALSFIDEGIACLSLLGVTNYSLLQKIPVGSYELVLLPDFDRAGQSAAPSWSMHAILGGHYTSEIWLAPPQKIRYKDANEIKVNAGSVKCLLDGSIEVRRRNVVDALIDFAANSNENILYRVITLLSMVLPPAVYLGSVVRALTAQGNPLPSIPPADFSALIPTSFAGAHLIKAAGSSFALFLYALRSPKFRYIVLEHFLPHEVYPLMQMFPPEEKFKELPVGINRRDLERAVMHVRKVLRGARSTTFLELAEICEGGMFLERGNQASI